MQFCNSSRSAPCIMGLLNNATCALGYLLFTSCTNRIYWLVNCALSNGSLFFTPSPRLISLVPNAMLTMAGVYLAKFHCWVLSYVRSVFSYTCGISGPSLFQLRYIPIPLTL